MDELDNATDTNEFKLILIASLKQTIHNNGWSNNEAADNLCIPEKLVGYIMNDEIYNISTEHLLSIILTGESNW